LFDDVACDKSDDGCHLAECNVYIRTCCADSGIVSSGCTDNVVESVKDNGLCLCCPNGIVSCKNHVGCKNPQLLNICWKGSDAYTCKCNHDTCQTVHFNQSVC